MDDEDTPRHNGLEDTESGGQNAHYGELDGFYLVRRLGGGGMGDVYLAESRHNPEMKRAIKILRPDTREDISQVIDRWKVECQVSERLRGLKHKHIVQVYDGKKGDVFYHETEEAKEVFYLTMEYVEGDTLTTLLEGSSLTLEESLKLGVDIASALEAAHDIGVMHRDVKPGNIMVNYQVERLVEAYLLDFGISKLRFESGDITKRHGEYAVGTVQYMPPEELLNIIGRDAPETTERGDTYAFGKVLWETFSKVVNPDAERTETKKRRNGDAAAAMRALSWSPTSIPELSTDMNGLIRQMTLWNPDLRPEMREVRAILGSELYQKDQCAGTQPIRLAPQKVRLEELLKAVRNLTEDEFVRSQGKFVVVPSDGYFRATHPNMKVDARFARETTYWKVFAPNDKKEWLFGRGPDMDCRYSERTMSKKHFKISESPFKTEDGQPRYAITDLGSSNGTSLRGIKLEPNKPEFMASGDDIRAGDVLLTFARPSQMRKSVDTIEFKLPNEDRTPKQKRPNFDIQSGA